MFKIFLICFTFIATTSRAQTAYNTSEGRAIFFAEAPVSDIRGESKELTASIDTATGMVKGEIHIKSFAFDKSLMRKHFNERYMESDKFPIASFEGKIAEVIAWRTPGSYKTKVNGSIIIHGVKSRREFPVTISVGPSSSVLIQSVFKVKLADHAIEIPTLLFKEVTDEVEVSLTLNLNSVSRPNNQTGQTKTQNK